MARPNYLNPVSGKSNNQIEREARFCRYNFERYLNKRGIPTGNRLNVEMLIEYYIPEKLGYSLNIRDNLQGAEAMVDFQRRQLVLDSRIYEGILTGTPRYRFTSCHETGHIVMHAEQMTAAVEYDLDLVLQRREEIPPYANPESQADKFAAAMLMPNELVTQAIKDIDSRPFAIASIQSEFGVSKTAASIRLEQLGWKEENVLR